MSEIKNYIALELKFTDQNIDNIFDLSKKTRLKTFKKPLTENRYKLYVIKNFRNFLYIGITRQSLRNRFRTGLNSDGINGYHGYKWKNHKKIQLYVWCFDDYNEIQLENIEAELDYMVRNKTNSWPQFQNEIHFNNKFKKGKKIAASIFEILNDY